MLEEYAAAAGLGLLLGLRYRVAAVVAMSAALVVAVTAIGPFAGRSLWAALAAAFVAAFALQLGYLGGLLLMCAASRARSWPRIVRRQARSYRAILINALPRAR